MLLPARNPTVLVGGGAGYLGSHVVRALQQAGRRVVVADNLATGDAGRLGNVVFHRIDLLLEAAQLPALLRAHRVGAVMLCMTPASGGDDPAAPSCWGHHCEALRAMLEALYVAGVQRLVVSAHALPADTRYLGERLAAERQFHDATTRLGIATALLQYDQIGGADPDAQIGPLAGRQHGLVDALLESAAAADPSPRLSKGADPLGPRGKPRAGQVRLLHVADVARAHVQALDWLASGQAAGGAFDLAGAHAIDMEDLCEAAERATGRAVAVPLRLVEPAGTVATGDPVFERRPAAELGWTPRLSTAERIVADAWRWQGRAWSMRRPDVLDELSRRFPAAGPRWWHPELWRARWKRGAWRAVTASARALKRTLDIVVSLSALLALAPVLFVVAAIIKVQDGGPVLFWQKRVGRWGREFAFPKFRSMVPDAERRKAALLAQSHHRDSGVTFKMKRDPRITPFGRIMRKLSIDELPQLWCVLVGDMSLVGPRPPLPQEVARYRLTDRRRLDVQPGLTCIWQVSGRGDIGFDQQVELDVEYIRSQSLWTDLKLLVRTVPAVLVGRGAY